jgi:hypothetical protein
MINNAPGRNTFASLTMIELIRTDDAVLVSWLEVRLSACGIPAVVLDSFTSSAYGGALDGVRCRVMVDDEDLPRAREILAEAAVPRPEDAADA